MRESATGNPAASLWRGDLRREYDCGMSKARSRLILALLLASIPASFASYAIAYFLMQTAQTGRNAGGVFTVRYFPTDWHVVLFQPAATVESVIRQRDIQVEYTP